MSFRSSSEPDFLSNGTYKAYYLGKNIDYPFTNGGFYGRGILHKNLAGIFLTDFFLPLDFSVELVATDTSEGRLYMIRFVKLSK